MMHKRKASKVASMSCVTNNTAIWDTHNKRRAIHESDIQTLLSTKPTDFHAIGLPDFALEDSKGFSYMFKWTEDLFESVLDSGKAQEVYSADASS